MPQTIILRLAAALGLFALVCSTAQADARYRAEIRRTAFGIPHIKAKDYAGIGYGLGYAYAQDNFCLLAERIVTVNGERSKFFGPDAQVTLVSAPPVSNLDSDFLFKSQLEIGALRRAANGFPQDVKDMLRGYATGYNRYLRETGPEGLPATCRGAAWVRPMTEDDQLRLSQDQLVQLDFETPVLLHALLDAAPPSPTSTSATTSATSGSATARLDATQGLAITRALDNSGLGSNGWAFGRAVTRNASGVLLGNPHYPWDTVDRFYEAHLTIPGRLDVMGAALPGIQGIVIGFNKNVAWTHTIASDRHFTLFELTLDPSDPTVYIVDGTKRTMERRTVNVSVAREGRIETRTRVLYSSLYGPIVVQPRGGLLWTTQHAYAERDANDGNFRSLTTSLSLDRARTVAEIRSILSDTRSPYANTLATDRHGDVLYADITPTPDITAEKLHTCAPSPGAATLAAAARIFVLDGSRSSCDWNPQTGLVPPDKLPQLVRTDFVANSNDSFWLANPTSPITDEPAIVGLAGVRQNLRTRAGLVEIERRLKGEDDLSGRQVGPEDVRAMIFRNRNFAADLFLDDILSACGSGADDAPTVNGKSVVLDSACATLAKWDRRMNVDSRGAYLFQEIWRHVEEIKNVYAVPFDAADPIHTPRGLGKRPDNIAAIRQAIAAAVVTLTGAGMPLDAPLGELQFRVAGTERIPLGGGDGLDGVLNALKCAPDKSGGCEPVSGSSYLQIVTFDRRGPVASAVLTYSQSADPTSAHYADQTRLYSASTLARLPFLESEITADKTLTSVTIAE